MENKGYGRLELNPAGEAVSVVSIVSIDDLDLLSEVDRG